MALNWEWKNKIGEATIRESDGREFVLNLYTGNADVIWLWEYEDNGEKYYTMYSFWDDEVHAKRCLGLEKGYDNNLEGRLKKFKIDKGYRKALKYINLIAKAFDDITIEIYTKEEQNG